MLALRANIRLLSSRNLLRRLYLDPACCRSLSTVHLDPTIRGFAAALLEKQPCFSMHPKNVHVLSEPQQFHQRLLDMIRRARRRIFISSLYIGHADKRLIDTLHEALHDNAGLNVYLHLDLNRSTRPGSSSTAQVLLPLLRDHPNRVHVSLFRSPKLRGIMAKLVPPRFNEGWGTWHAKVYGVDDEVMISGANLNRSYYTNRQDRYIHFTQPALAQYCFSFLESMSTCSYQLLPTTSAMPNEGYRLEWPDPKTHPHDIESKAGKALTKLQASFMSSSTTTQHDPPDTASSEVLVFPIIQAGQFNIREEEQCLSMLFDHLAIHETSKSLHPSMDLTSGYFGLYKPYQDLILGSSIDCQIIAASPMANGFYGSRGLSGRIPDGYTLLEQRFIKAVNAVGRNWSVDGGKGIQLNEWAREGWTYHAKGIWLSPTPDSAPILSLFGSTNLNSRSSHLDTELSFVMMTSSDVLRQKLQEEVQALRQWAVPWKGHERRVPWTTKVIAGIVGGML